MTEKADAKEEAEVQAEGADQDNVTDPEFDAGFEDEANDRPKVDTDPDGALKLEPDKPATPAGDRPRGPDGKFLPADAKPEGDKRSHRTGRWRRGDWIGRSVCAGRRQGA